MTQGSYPPGTASPKPSDAEASGRPSEVEVWQALLDYFQSSTPARAADNDISVQPGQPQTLSLFSELRFALGTPRDGAAPQQQLTTTVEKVGCANYKIVYGKDTLPADANLYDLFYADGTAKTDRDIPRATDGTVTIQLDASPSPLTLLAVKIKKLKEVLLVSFATHPAPQG
jgi:hypothetical protein